MRTLTVLFVLGIFMLACSESGDPTMQPFGDDGDLKGADTAVVDTLDTQSIELDAEVCEPSCQAMDCGDDGCGGICGSCWGGQVCLHGMCVCAAEAYKACCGQAVCWFDSCGDQGKKVVDCPKGCASAVCIDCTPDCAGKICGEDGCGGDCGSCTPGRCDELQWTTPAACVSGQCASEGAIQDCSEQNSCTRDFCDPKVGCGHKHLDDGTECVPGTCNGLVWTSPMTCVSGACTVGGDMETCTDNNPCTDDTCFGKTGCAFIPNTNPCDDGDQCTVTDTCSIGKCKGLGAKDCNDNNPCTADICDKDVGCKNEEVEDGTICVAGSCAGLVWTKPAVCNQGTCTPIGIQSCDDSLVCTTDTCDPKTGCMNKLDAGKCLIGGACYEGGAPGATCLACKPDENTTSWTYMANATCDDGNPCTKDDQCTAMGAPGCNGTMFSCDDGLYCTTDTCDGKGGCTNPLLTGYCVIGGKCWDDNQLNPENPCLVCSVLASTTAWSNAKDGMTCGGGTCSGLTFTSAKTCLAGQCTGGGGSQNCDDGNACTTDSCAPAGCNSVVQSGFCLIPGKGCVPTGQANPANACQTCVPTKSAVMWSDATDGTTCIAAGCTGLVHAAAKTCVSGQCIGGGTTTNCDDVITCTTDSCTPTTGCGNVLQPESCLISGVCRGDGEANPLNLCQACRATQNALAWSNVTDGTTCGAGTCNDLVFTSAKTCQSGQCSGGGGSLNCDDGKPCTQDSCSPTSGCTSVLDDGYCLIGGVCYSEGQPHPSIPCQVCTSDKTVSAWSNAVDDTICVSGTCSGLAWTTPKTCSFGQCSGGGGVQSCDDANSCTTDSCDPGIGCKHNATANCCGNGLPEAGEQCDDGNQVNWDGCTSCKITEFRVNTSIQGDQKIVKQHWSGRPVATDSQGRFLIAWTTSPTFDLEQDAYLQLFNADGSTAGAEIRANTYTAERQELPSVAFLAGGGFVVVWRSVGQTGPGSGIFAQRFAPTGTQVGLEFRVNTTTASERFNPSVAAFADGTFVVTWQAYNGDGNGQGILARRFNADGSGIGNEFVINSYTAGEQSGASVAPLDNGRFVVVWSSGWPTGTGQDGSSFGVFGSQFKANGTLDGTEFQINQYTPDFQYSLSVAGMSDGRFVATWWSGCLPSFTCGTGQDGSGRGVYARRFNADGLGSSEFRVNNFTTGDQDGSAVAMFANGSFVVVWQSAAQDGSGLGMYGQRFLADGAPLGGEFLVNSFTAGDQKWSAVATFSDGSFVVAWTSAGQDGSGQGVFAQRFNNDGTKKYR